MYPEAWNSGVNAVPQLRLDTEKVGVERMRWNPDDLSGCTIPVLSDADDNVAAIGVGKRSHIGKKIFYRTITTAGEGQLEIKRSPLGPSVAYQGVKIVLSDLI